MAGSFEAFLPEHGVGGKLGRHTGGGRDTRRKARASRRQAHTQEGLHALAHRPEERREGLDVRPADIEVEPAGAGTAVTEFEETFARRLGARHCLATSGGTTALWTALNALDVGPKDEVLVPPYTFIATVNVILLQHALPVFVDTDRETFQIDAKKIEDRITPRTRCILPVHLGGASAEMDLILTLGKKHQLSVVEDACQSHLAEWRQQPVSTLGDIGCFQLPSFEEPQLRRRRRAHHQQRRVNGASRTLPFQRRHGRQDGLSDSAPHERLQPAHDRVSRSAALLAVRPPRRSGKHAGKQRGLPDEHAKRHRRHRAGPHV